MVTMKYIYENLKQQDILLTSLLNYELTKYSNQCLSYNKLQTELCYVAKASHKLDVNSKKGNCVIGLCVLEACRIEMIISVYFRSQISSQICIFYITHKYLIYAHAMLCYQSIQLSKNLPNIFFFEIDMLTFVASRIT